MILAGIDEAGRGCLIGPLVIAGLTISEYDQKKLIDFGVKDSKTLSVKKREKLTIKITSIAKSIKYFHIEPKFIDVVVNRNKKLKKLNYLEAMGMAKIIRELGPSEAYVDAADVNPIRFAEEILAVLPVKPRLICEHRADKQYPVVSAASILAKVKRDSIINGLKKIYGDFNSGYPSDPKTILWLKDWYSKNKSMPEQVRGSWAPVKKIQIHSFFAKTNA
jgi:ribonuclease HII